MGWLATAQEESSSHTEGGAQLAQQEDDGYLSDDRSFPGRPSTSAHVPSRDMRGAHLSRPIQWYLCSHVRARVRVHQSASVLMYCLPDVY